MSPLKRRLWWFLPKKEVLPRGKKLFCEFFKAIQDEAIISISLVRAVTKDTVPLETTLPVTFHRLILCSNLGNCLNHRELIPVMPLPPPSPELYRAHASYHWPWFTLNTSQAQRFSGPQAPIGICLPPLSKNGPVFCLHTLFSPPDCGSPFFFYLFFFISHQILSCFSAPTCRTFMAHIGAVLFNLTFCQVFHRNRLDDNTKKKKPTHKEHNLYTHGLYRRDESCVYKVTNALRQKHVACKLIFKTRTLKHSKPLYHIMK